MTFVFRPKQQFRLRSQPEATFLEDDESFGSLEGLDRFSPATSRNGGTAPDIPAVSRASQSADPRADQSADEHVTVEEIVTSSDEDYIDGEEEDIEVVQTGSPNAASITVNKNQFEKGSSETVTIVKDDNPGFVRINSAAATDRNPQQEVRSVAITLFVQFNRLKMQVSLRIYSVKLVYKALF